MSLHGLCGKPLSSRRLLDAFVSDSFSCIYRFSGRPYRTHPASSRFHGRPRGLHQGLYIQKATHMLSLRSRRQKLPFQRDSRQAYAEKRNNDSLLFWISCRVSQQPKNAEKNQPNRLKSDFLWTALRRFASHQSILG